MKFYNLAALINQVSDEDLATVGIYFDGDKIKGLEKLTFPVEIELEDCPMEQYDWDHVREGRFDLSGQRPEEYARPAPVK